MQLALTPQQLLRLVTQQLKNLFLFDTKQETPILKRSIPEALKRCDYCFSHIQNKYYRHNGATFFNPYHSGQYTIFLYYLANTIFKAKPMRRSLADRLYYLNKALNAVDLFYEVSLPAIFFLDHPLGSVMGRASYGDHFAFSQGCTVGNNKGLYPRIGQNVKMMSGSKILGNCTIGDNVILSANTYIKDEDILPGSIVFGSSPNLIVKQKDTAYFEHV